MAKNIVFCADGTWNGPDIDENDDGTPEWTNVYKLFVNLAGAPATDSIRLADEQETVFASAGGEQVAKYLHGVGDSRNPIVKIMGGAFGAGLISRVVRGYTFVSRNYQPGDRVYLVGFSRGAYTARALAGLIVSQGLLRQALATADEKEAAYRYGAEAWYRYRSSALEKTGFLDRLGEVVADLPAFLSSEKLRNRDFVPVDRIAAVGVWDTVGALGIPIFVGDERSDAFRFADTRLSPKVAAGFHAVSLDEQRCDFSPTLWDPAPNVTQALFPGAHADVGGGYPMSNRESELSDGALVWMTERLRGAGVLFDDVLPYAPHADSAGTAHKPWAKSLYKKAARRFPSGMPEDPSVEARVKAGPVRADPAERAKPYAPGNRPSA